MTFQSIKGEIHWKIHLASSPEKVFAALTTDVGRSRFWAESAVENDGLITFKILNYENYTGKVLIKDPITQFSVEYFGTIATFDIQPDKRNGTDLILTATQVDESIRPEMTAGWVSVLLALKAAVDHDVDLRNHDQQRTWSNGYADN